MIIQRTAIPLILALDLLFLPGAAAAAEGIQGSNDLQGPSALATPVRPAKSRVRGES